MRNIVLLMLVCLVQAVAAEPVRIMAVGDSITQGGKTFTTYRLPLAPKLKAAGRSFVFVGSQVSDSPLGSLRHEGYGGKNAEFLASILEAKLKEHPADILLIHSGHNHSAEEKPIPGIIAATRGMITTARRSNPKVTVLLAQVITSGKLPKYSYLPALNQALADLAKELDVAGQRVVLVDMAQGFDWKTDAVADRVHPNEQGAEKIAARWMQALDSVWPK